MSPQPTVVDLIAAAVAASAGTAAPVAPVAAVQTATVTYQGVTIKVERVSDDPRTKGDDWSLSATLTYITTSPIPITYHETFTGTYDQAVSKASDRARELAALKAAHDSIHVRINDMSAGKA